MTKSWSTDAKLAAALVLGAIAVRLVFWVYTDRVWEDALITILNASNFVRGVGLTHFKVNEGVVHAFTSPFSVLIPLVGEVMHLGWGLTTIRIASLVAAAATVIFAVQMNRAYPSLRLPAYGILMFAGFYAFEHHQTLWGMAGMETQIATCVLVLALLCYQRDWRLALGVTLALALYSRPDFALAVAIIGLFLLYRAFSTKQPAAFLVPFSVSVLLYAPWIIFTILYYGSPVPNSMRAKANYGMWWEGAQSAADVLRGGWERAMNWVFITLGPSFGGHGTGFMKLWDNGVIFKIMLGFLVVGVVFAVVKKQRDLLLPYAVLFVYTIYYAFGVPGMFGWYMVPIAGLTSILAAKGLCDLTRAVLPDRAAATTGWIVSGAYIACIIGVLPTTYTAEKRVHELVEVPVRVAIGEYLKANTPPRTTVGGEPIGFIGFYSERNYFDWPGLTSRRTAEYLATAKYGKGMDAVSAEYRPDYLVLRNNPEGARESDRLATSYWDAFWFNQEYTFVKQFSVPKEDRAKLLHLKANVDVDFGLWKRKEEYQRQNWRDMDLWPKTPRKIPVTAELTNCVENGQYGDPPPGRKAWGSYMGDDGHTGRVVLKMTVAPEVPRILVPIVTGPVSQGLTVTLINQETGETVAAPAPLPTYYARWKGWIADLPPSTTPRSLALVVEDQGTSRGQWVGVAEPEALGPATEEKPALPHVAELQSKR